MKILILGGSGMLGHKVVQASLEAGHDVKVTVSNQASQERLLQYSICEREHLIEGINAMNLQQIRTVIHSVGPDVIINCIGIIKQYGASKQEVPSLSINSVLPHFIAGEAQVVGSRMIHISTDCVFDGKKGDYSELDEPNANDLYGKSKALGEVTQYPGVLTLRTSIIGRELNGHVSLLDWAFSQSRSRVSGYRSAFFSGLTTNRLSRFIIQEAESADPLEGLFQVSGPKIDKYSLLQLFNKFLGTDLNVVADDDLKIDRSLSSQRLHSRTGYYPPSWEEMLLELAEDSTAYPLLGISK